MTSRNSDYLIPTFLRYLKHGETDTPVSRGIIVPSYVSSGEVSISDELMNSS
jgi:hypothetical protein